MAFAADVGDHFETVRQTNLADLPQRGVRLFRCRRVDASANAALLRAILQRRNFTLADHRFARLADQLVNGWHISIPIQPVAPRPEDAKTPQTPQGGLNPPWHFFIKKHRQ